MAFVLDDVRSRERSGSYLLFPSISHFDPSATSTGLKFRSVAVACAISFVPKRGKALSSQTAHGHQTPRPSVFAQDDGRRTEPATTELRRMVPRVGARPNAA